MPSAFDYSKFETLLNGLATEMYTATYPELSAEAMAKLDRVLKQAHLNEKRVGVMGIAFAVPQTEAEQQMIEQLVPAYSARLRLRDINALASAYRDTGDEHVEPRSHVTADWYRNGCPERCPDCGC